MSTGSHEQTGEGPRALALLLEIKTGRFDPKFLCPADRRVLVSVLMVEGQSTADTAHLLGVSDKTIEQDKRAIREQNAIAKNPKFVEQMVGRFVSEVETSMQRIRKAVREKDVSITDKIQGEHRCSLILDTVVERLQKLGYLLTAPRKLEAEVVEQHGLPTLAEIQRESLRLARIDHRHPPVLSEPIVRKTAEFDVIEPGEERDGYAEPDGSA